MLISNLKMAETGKMRMLIEHNTDSTQDHKNHNKIIRDKNKDSKTEITRMLCLN
jgi:hypothetical protein